MADLHIHTTGSGPHLVLLHWMRLHTATLTGLEPATSAVTGRHANQLRYRALQLFNCRAVRDPNGIRTRAAAVKGRCPRPLNDGAVGTFAPWATES